MENYGRSSSLSLDLSYRVPENMISPLTQTNHSKSFPSCQNGRQTPSLRSIALRERLLRSLWAKAGQTGALSRYTLLLSRVTFIPSALTYHKMRKDLLYSSSPIMASCEHLQLHTFIIRSLTRMLYFCKTGIPDTRYLNRNQESFHTI